MGFLATAEVKEVSSSELIGQYVGQTGPKTQKMLEKALGKVLFVDEAYRLAEGQFAKESQAVSPRPWCSRVLLPIAA